MKKDMKKLLNNTHEKVQITIYLKVAQCINVSAPQICLEDVAEIWCDNNEILSLVKKIRVKNKNEITGTQCVISLLDVISQVESEISDNYQNIDLDVSNLGEPDFVLKWEKHTNQKWENIKVIFICLIVFFGASFAIMSFNEDVAVETLFQKIYKSICQKEHEGFGVMEFMYGIGIAVGVLLFFNHFGKKKITQDPTPSEVKMNQYEEDVNKYVISEGEKE